MADLAYECDVLMLDHLGFVKRWGKYEKDKRTDATMRRALASGELPQIVSGFEHSEEVGHLLDRVTANCSEDSPTPEQQSETQES